MKVCLNERKSGSLVVRKCESSDCPDILNLENVCLSRGPDNLAQLKFIGWQDKLPLFIVIHLMRNRGGEGGGKTLRNTALRQSKRDF